MWNGPAARRRSGGQHPIKRQIRNRRQAGCWPAAYRVLTCLFAIGAINTPIRASLRAAINAFDRADLFVPTRWCGTQRSGHGQLLRRGTPPPPGGGVDAELLVGKVHPDGDHPDRGSPDRPSSAGSRRRTGRLAERQTWPSSAGAVAMARWKALPLPCCRRVCSSPAVRLTLRHLVPRPAVPCRPARP